MPQKNRTVKGVLGGLLGLVGLSAVAGVLATAAVTPAIAIAGVSGSQALSIFENLPDSLTPGTPMEPTVIYGRNESGKPFELAKFYDQNRVPVTFDEVSPLLYDAVLSSEDKNFYEHGGVNLGATVKAVVDNLRGTSSRGASTISQQFVKNVQIQQCERKATPGTEGYQDELHQCWVDATNAKGADGVERKLQEMRYAIQIEKDFSKNDILLGYLNVANFGGQTYGIEAASNYYFHTTAKKLSLAQAATLAGMVQNPNRFRFDKKEGSWTDASGKARNSKADGYADTKLRRNYVLDRMLKDGKITKKQHDNATALPVKPNIHPSTQGCASAGDQAYFCQYAKSVIQDDEAFGKTPAQRRDMLQRGGLKIYTSLDMRVQKPAVAAMHARVPAKMPGILLGGAGVSIEASTGRILAIAQNTKFSESAGAKLSDGKSSQVFAADRAHAGGTGFGPGSTYKLFTLLQWLEDGHSVNEVLDGRVRNFGDFPQCGGTYKQTEIVGNFGQGGGSVSTVGRFTSASLNTGFLAMAQQLDLCDINKMAKRLGVHWGDGGDVTTHGLYWTKNDKGETVQRLGDTDPAKGIRTDANDPFPTVLGSKSIAPIQMAGAYATVANKGIYCEPRVIDKIVGRDGKEIDPPKTSCTQVISPEVAATAAYALRGVMEGGTGSGANPYDGIQVIGKTGTAELEHTMLVESSTKVATAVWIGNINGQKALRDFQAYGTRLNNIRYPLARDLQRAANAVYGGDRFPAPDRNLTRRVMKDLPNVVGKSIDEATSIIEAAGFSVRVGEPVDSTVAKDLVAEQTPGAGKVPGGTTVTLIPSTGKAPAPETVEVPNVTGEKFGQAKRTLEDADLSVDAPDCRGGAPVTAQNPPGDTSVPPGTTVTLTCEVEQ